MINNNVKLGDTVKLITYTGSNEILCIGDEGIVVEIIGFNNLIGIDWGKNIDGHTCDGTCTDTYGWRVSCQSIKIINKFGEPIKIIKMDVLNKLEQYY